MLINKIGLLLVCGLVLVGCASDRYVGNLDQKPVVESDRQLGVKYLLGRGVPQNDQKAFHYFLNAADDDDDAFAQNEVAYMYATGKGVEVNQEKAFDYYKLAAESGLVSAQYSLGIMYERGMGTPVNIALAMEAYKQSADHGFEPAKRRLALLSRSQ